MIITNFLLLEIKMQKVNTVYMYHSITSIKQTKNTFIHSHYYATSWDHKKKVYIPCIFDINFSIIKNKIFSYFLF